MTGTQGDLLADAALQQVEQAADAAWLAAAKNVVWQLIKEGEGFTTDHVWERLDALGVHTHEPRALGAVMRAAARAGWISNTGSYFKSGRPGCHSRPIPLWLPKRRAA